MSDFPSTTHVSEARIRSRHNPIISPYPLYPGGRPEKSFCAYSRKVNPRRIHSPEWFPSLLSPTAAQSNFHFSVRQNSTERPVPSNSVPNNPVLSNPVPSHPVHPDTVSSGNHVRREAAETIPPNVSAEITSDTSSRELEDPPQAHHQKDHQEHIEPPPEEPPKSRFPKRSVLRQATRFVVAAVPNQAHVVMQQQHLIARLLGARLRVSWKAIMGRNPSSEGQVQPPSPTIPTLGRRSRARRKRKRQQQRTGSAAADLATRSSPPGDEDKKNFIGRTVRDPEAHRLELAFFKETSIEARPVDTTPTSTIALDSDPQLPIHATLPKDLQPSLEVSLGSAEPSTVLGSSPTLELSSPTDQLGMTNKLAPSLGVSTEGQLDQSELLRSYEAVLQVVIASGVVEADAKRFLNDYRTRVNIKVTQHNEALKRLGWSAFEYEQGYSSSSSAKISSWRRLWNRVLDLCEKGGNTIVTLGSLASLTSIMMANMAQLRMLQLISGSFFFIYNMTRRPPLTASAYWNLVFFSINSMMLTKLFLETRPEALSEEELDVFERHFQETGLTPRRFKQLMEVAHSRHASKGTVLVKKGEGVRDLMLVRRGEVSVFLNGNEVERLEGGTKNAIIGLKTFLTRIDSERKFAARGKVFPATSGLPLEEPIPSRRLPGMGPMDSQVLVTTSLMDEEKVQREESSNAVAGSAASHRTLSLGGIPTTSLSDGDQSIHSELVDQEYKQCFLEIPEKISLERLIPDSSSPSPAVKSPPSFTDSAGVVSATTVVVSRDALLLVWPIEELVKRVVADPVNLGFPLVGGMAKALVARSRTQLLKQNLITYESAIKGVLSDGVCGAEEKQFLQECRQRLNVSEEQHWALVEQLGWTKEEFAYGTRGNVNSIKFILSKVKDQLGFTAEPPGGTMVTSPVPTTTTTK